MLVYTFCKQYLSFMEFKFFLFSYNFYKLLTTTIRNVFKLTYTKLMYYLSFCKKVNQITFKYKIKY